MITMHTCYVKDYTAKWKMDKSSTQFHVFFLVTRGSIEYWVNDEPVIVQKGDALLIPADSIRGGVAMEEHQRYVTHFSMAETDKVMLPILTDQQYCKVSITGLEYFKQRFMLLKHHWLMKGPYMATTCYAILLEMFSIMNYDRDHWKLPSMKRDMVEDIKNYILDHYKEAVMLSDLSDYVGRTPNHVSYVFKNVTGFSPIDYLHHVRISKAKELMFDRMISIREIADETGFCDQAYFNRVFKKVTGFSPTAFLKGRTY
jgi:YesN/AraC family two-component response regulator